jgi:hypothetical protein
MRPRALRLSPLPRPPPPPLSPNHFPLLRFLRIPWTCSHGLVGLLDLRMGFPLSLHALLPLLYVGLGFLHRAMRCWGCSLIGVEVMGGSPCGVQDSGVFLCFRTPSSLSAYIWLYHQTLSSPRCFLRPALLSFASSPPLSPSTPLGFWQSMLYHSPPPPLGLCHFTLYLAIGVCQFTLSLRLHLLLGSAGYPSLFASTSSWVLPVIHLSSPPPPLGFCHFTPCLPLHLLLGSGSPCSLVPLHLLLGSRTENQICQLTPSVPLHLLLSLLGLSSHPVSSPLPPLGFYDYHFG